MVESGSRALTGPAKICQPLRGFEKAGDGKNTEKRLWFSNRRGLVMTKSYNLSTLCGSAAICWRLAEARCPVSFRDYLPRKLSFMTLSECLTPVPS